LYSQAIGSPYGEPRVVLKQMFSVSTRISEKKALDLAMVDDDTSDPLMIDLPISGT
jgi:hypothetical protein